jgi:hypothetical protein
MTGQAPLDKVLTHPHTPCSSLEGSSVLRGSSELTHRCDIWRRVHFCALQSLEKRQDCKTCILHQKLSSDIHQKHIYYTQGQAACTDSCFPLLRCYSLYQQQTLKQINSSKCYTQKSCGFDRLNVLEKAKQALQLGINSRFWLYYFDLKSESKIIFGSQCIKEGAFISS